MRGKKGWVLWMLLGCLITVLSIGGCAKKDIKPEEPAKVQAPDDEQLKAMKQKELEEQEAAKKRVRIREEEVSAKPPVTETPLKEQEKSLAWMKEKEAFELEDVHFEYDKYDLTAKARDILTRKAEWLKKNPNVKLQVEGHCDERGSTEYNLALGDRRAESVKQYLTTMGVQAGHISTISYGKEKPLDPGHNEQAWVKNRRAHFVVR